MGFSSLTHRVFFADPLVCFNGQDPLSVNQHIRVLHHQFHWLLHKMCAPRIAWGEHSGFTLVLKFAKAVGSSGSSGSGLCDYMNE